MRLIKTIPGKSFAFWENRGFWEFLGRGREGGNLLVIGGVDRSCLGPALSNAFVSDPSIDKIRVFFFVARLKRDISRWTGIKKSVMKRYWCE